MRMHPALFMIVVWLGALSAFLVLPFQLTYRTISTDGFLILLAFLAVFCLGGLLRTVYLPQRPVQAPTEIDFSRADLLLKSIAVVGCISMGYELVRGAGLDLASAYTARSEQAQAMLLGTMSQSSGAFKIGFLCYPASYVYLVRAVLFKSKPNWVEIFIFGVLPGALASLAMGGRTPLFSTMAYAFLAYAARPYLWGRVKALGAAKPHRIHPLVKIVAIVLALIGFNYFINVFITRAELDGGGQEMLRFAAIRWGVTFGGPQAEWMVDLLGSTTTYLIFVFVWYFIQGIVISNSLFATYTGGPLMGVYGIEITTAIMRRLDPDGVAQNFKYLLDHDIYGFYPSAFGTLYVDYLYGGLVIALVWGWLAALVYRNTRLGQDARWFVFAPFVTLGIFFSIVNTPLGFSNGFITHVWLVLAFVLMRRPADAVVARNSSTT